MIWPLYDWLNNPCCFPVSIYGPCHIIHRHDLRNEMCCQLKPKKSKVYLY